MDMFDSYRKQPAPPDPPKADDVPRILWEGPLYNETDGYGTDARVRVVRVHEDNRGTIVPENIVEIAVERDSLGARRWDKPSGDYCRMAMRALGRAFGG
jgi:hypothetical protein